MCAAFRGCGSEALNANYMRRPGPKSSPFNIWLKRMAVRRIRETLLLADGDRIRAARMLGIDRTTMFRYLRWDELRVERLADSDVDRRKESEHPANRASGEQRPQWEHSSGQPGCGNGAG